MRKLLTLSAGIACAFSISAQSAKEIHYADGSMYKECYSVRATKPLRDIIAERHARGLDKLVPKNEDAIDSKGHEAYIKKAHHPGTNSPVYDPALQTEPGHLVGSTIENFEGQDGYGEYPLDPNGMIGTNYYVQTINSTIAAWDKSGGSYIPQTTLDALFGSDAEGNWGDPITIYDKMADRWIISEFEGELSNSTIDTLCFAVSQTNDPNGSYWIYAFDPYVNAFDDYPKYNVWGNGYYMTCNCSSPDFVCCYERDSMLVGSPHAAFIAMPWAYGPSGNWNCEGDFFCPMMLDCDGTLPPANAPEFLFYYWDDTWGCGGSEDSICIQKITVDWSTKTGTIDGNFQHLASAAFSSNFSNTEAFDNIIPQPGNNTSDLLASTDGFFGYRIPYLRWTSYNSAVMQFPVNIGTLAVPIAAVRWYELWQDTTTLQWSIHQQSTYGTTDGVSRWEAAIAQDMNGDIGLEYSVSGPDSVYPGIRYTGRRYCDPLNTMTLAEGIAATGNAIVNAPEDAGNRWGDYSHLSVDPSDGITFWGTNMYAENGVNGQNMGTRVFSFQVPTCPTDVPNVVNSYNASLKAYQNGSMLNIIATDFPMGERLVVQLFDVNGKMLMQQETTTNTDKLETAFNIASLAKAIYLVRVGNDHVQRVVKVPVQ